MVVAGIISLVSYGIASGGQVGNFLYRLENLGFFSYVLPFLVIFALIYAILSKAGFLGNNNAINVILSLAVSLMALQFNFVSYFFAQIFPRMGIVLSIIIVLMILMGLFVKFDDKWPKIFFGIFTGVAGVVIVFQSFSESFGWGNWNLFNSPFWWSLQNNFPMILVFILVLGGIIAIPILGNRGNGKRDKNSNPHI